MEKICFVCGLAKPINDFYKHKGMADGHLGKCKECAKRYGRVRLIEKPEHVRARDMRRQTPERIAKTTEHVRKWRLDNPEKYRAQNMVNNAIRDGKIEKPTICEICGKVSRLHAHHEDYSKPFLVVWVCPECHGQIQ